jgi:phage shock protein PspC (stress-responsive transcriptional regulator)
MKNVLKRLKEPSTWAGFAGLAVLFGVDPVKANVLVQAVGAVAAGLAVLLPEVKHAVTTAADE